jgi:hypothetical protein
MHRKFPNALIEAATARLANADAEVRVVVSGVAKADAEVGVVVSGKKNVFLIRAAVIDKVMQNAARKGAESEHKEVKVAASVLGAFCITAMSTQFTNPVELSACVDAMQRKGIHGLSGAKAFVSIATHYAATGCPCIPDSKSNKKPVKSALKYVLNHIADQETRSTESPDYAYWLARRLIKAADKAAVGGDFTGVYNARKRDVHAAIIDALLKNRSSRHFLAFMLDIDIDTSNVDFKAALEAAMVGFVAGLPNFFDAPAVPSALVDFTAGPVTATPAETAPLDTLSEPATALMAVATAPPALDSLTGGIKFNLCADGIEAGGLGALAHALVPAQPTPVRGAPPSSYDYNAPAGRFNAVGLGFATPGFTPSAGAGGGAMPGTFGGGGFGATAAIELLGTGTPASMGGGAVPMTAETPLNFFSMIALGQIEQLTAELNRIKELPKGSPEKTILPQVRSMLDELKTTLKANQELLVKHLQSKIDVLLNAIDSNKTATLVAKEETLAAVDAAKEETFAAVDAAKEETFEMIKGLGDVFVDSFEKISTNLKGINAEIEKGNQNLKGINAEIDKGNQETAKAFRELFSRKAPASTPVPAPVSAAGPSGGLTYGGASASNAAPPAPRGTKCAARTRPVCCHLAYRPWLVCAQNLFDARGAGQGEGGGQDAPRRLSATALMSMRSVRLALSPYLALSPCLALMPCLALACIEFPCCCTAHGRHLAAIALAAALALPFASMPYRRSCCLAARLLSPSLTSQCSVPKRQKPFGVGGYHRFHCCLSGREREKGSRARA